MYGVFPSFLANLGSTIPTSLMSLFNLIYLVELKK